MKSLSYLNKYFIKYKWRLLAGVFFAIGTNYFAVKMPEFLKIVTDNFIEDAQNPFTILWLDLPINTKDPVSIGLTYMGLIVVAGIFLFFLRQSIIKVSRFIEYDLKNEIYTHYQRLDYSFYKKNNTGDLMNRISEDVSYVRLYLGPAIMYTLNLVILFAMVIGQMILINSWLTLLVLIPLPIMSFLIYKVSSKMNRLSSKVQEEQSALSTTVQETFSGIRIIKAYSREKEMDKQFKATSKEYKRKSMRLVLVNALFMPTIMLLIGLSTVIIIYFGGLLHYDLEYDKNNMLISGITLGSVTAFIFYVNKLTWPFASVGWVTSLTQRAAASQTRINEFLQTEPKIYNASKLPFNFKGTIEFKHVTYTYPNSGIVAVKDLSFTIKPNETIAFIGRTGCGKSTILKLILRQIDPDSGEIFIDGQNIKDINLEDFRDQSGVVPQEVFLFSDTIRNNLKFGALSDSVTEDDLARVTKAAHVYHNIIDFKDGFDTLLGERGVNLSGGQKQRISIARALIRDPKLLLFDDCLSAVDTETEEIILSNLKSDISQKTSIIVSHRVSSLRNADRILVIDNGCKVEEGSHEELMELGGVYNELYVQQLAEENA